jgi:hypothetical protein
MPTFQAVVSKVTTPGYDKIKYWLDRDRYRIETPPIAVAETSTSTLRHALHYELILLPGSDRELLDIISNCNSLSE